MQNDAGAPIRVLFADDNAEIFTLVVGAFQRAGFAVDAASRGDDALSLYRAARADRQRYDFVLLDVAMPGLNGYEVAQCIRVDDSATLIAFFTAFDEPMAAVRAQVVHACGVWSKPADLLRLPQMIEEVLNAT